MVVVPICPHCSEPVKGLEQTLTGTFASGTVVILTCPSCEKVLGIVPQQQQR